MQLQQEGFVAPSTGVRDRPSLVAAVAAAAAAAVPADTTMENAEISTLAVETSTPAVETIDTPATPAAVEPPVALVIRTKSPVGGTSNVDDAGTTLAWAGKDLSEDDDEDDGPVPVTHFLDDSD